MGKPKFGEPWNKVGKQGIRTNNETFIGDAYYDPARRIVACVNALEGIDDPAAELARLREIEKHLIAAQDMICLLMSQREWGAATGALCEDSVVKKARAALAAKGENSDG